MAKAKKDPEKKTEDKAPAKPKKAKVSFGVAALLEAGIKTHGARVFDETTGKFNFPRRAKK
jgi:hypothetical protein